MSCPKFQTRNMYFCLCFLILFVCVYKHVIIHAYEYQNITTFYARTDLYRLLCPSVCPYMSDVTVSSLSAFRFSEDLFKKIVNPRYDK